MQQLEERVDLCVKILFACAGWRKLRRLLVWRGSMQKKQRPTISTRLSLELAGIMPLSGKSQYVFFPESRRDARDIDASRRIQIALHPSNCGPKNAVN